MKVFVIFEDNPNAPGGVTVNVMPQLTINEIAAGTNPFGSIAGQAALAAKAHIDAMRNRAEKTAAAINQVVDMAERGQCLH